MPRIVNIIGIYLRQSYNNYNLILQQGNTVLSSIALNLY